MGKLELSGMGDHDLLVRIATKVEELTGNGQPGRMTRAEEDIQGLKLWRSYLAGAIAVILLALTIGTPILLAKLK